MASTPREKVSANERRTVGRNMSCPHRRWRDVGPHYECRECPETLAKGEPETEPVGMWADVNAFRKAIEETES
jgi:hypothetical protein